ncbi:MAG: phosphatase PAP2 family protein [Peptoniphilus sp.]|nr:phosphatase PAP2 family protein [Peptoniphilus sp.]
MEKLILDFIAKFQNTFLDHMAIAFDLLGSKGAVFVIIGLALMIDKRTRKMGIHVIISLIMCLVLGNLLLKPLIGRIRPYARFNIPIIIEPYKDFSFPSGHTYSAFATAFSIKRYDEDLGVFMIFVSVLMAFTRMYLYVHYPTDILGGVALGYVCAKMAEVTLQYVVKKRSEI